MRPIQKQMVSALYMNRRALQYDQPIIQPHYLRIRRLRRPPMPIRIDVILCSQDYAMIDAGDGLCGYILLRDYEYTDTNISDGGVFYIFAKFRYRQGTPRNVEMLSMMNQGESVRETRALGGWTRLEAVVR